MAGYNGSAPLLLLLCALLPAMVSANGGMALYLGTILGSIFVGLVVIGILVFFVYFFCQKTVIKDYKTQHSSSPQTYRLGGSSVKLPAKDATVQYTVPAAGAQAAPPVAPAHGVEPRDSWMTSHSAQQQLGAPQHQAMQPAPGSVSIASSVPLPDGDRQRYGSGGQQPPVAVLYQPQPPPQQQQHYQQPAAGGFGSAV